MVDINKYKGKWYELDSFPAWFQKGCVDTTAEYTPNEHDNYIEVKNTCNIEKTECKDNICTKIKQPKVKIGKAFPTDDENLLKVQFFPLIKAPYKIEYVDENYENAIVGSGKDYLWILSRKPESNKMDELVQIAQNKGYDINKLQKYKKNK